jgi:hypothetical protein
MRRTSVVVFAQESATSALSTTIEVYTTVENLYLRLDGR